MISANFWRKPWREGIKVTVLNRYTCDSGSQSAATGDGDRVPQNFRSQENIKLSIAIETCRGCSR